MDDRIGTCSICGGPVSLPSMMVQPVARCERCGAHAKHPHGPVIPMERQPDDHPWNIFTQERLAELRRLGIVQKCC